MYESKDFYETLIENLESFNGEYASFIDCGPNLFKLLSDVFSQELLPKDLKLKVGATIAYYVIPNDVIPEEEFGPYGYIDDIFISVYVLREVANRFGYDFLQSLWHFDTDVKEVMDDCYNKSTELLEDKQEYILNFVGL